MSKEMKYIDISEIHNVPELVRIAEEVQSSKQPRVLTREGEELAIVSPAKPVPTRAVTGQPVTSDDVLFRLIGIGKSGIPGGISGKKHRYLARAYRHP